MTLHRKTRRMAIPVALTLGLAALVGCSADGSDDSGDSTTTTAAAETTTSAADETTTTDGGGGGDDTTTTTEPSGPTGDLDLDSAMLTAEELGAGWRQLGDISGPDTTEDESSAAMRAAIADQCPDLEGFFEPRDEVTRVATFKHEDDIDFEINLNPDPSDNYDPDRMDSIVDAMADCDLEIEMGGYVYGIGFQAQRTDQFGDISVEMIASFDVETEDGTMAWNMYNLAFQEGGISASIEMVDGLIGTETIAADTSLLLEAADILETRLADLQS